MTERAPTRSGRKAGGGPRRPRRAARLARPAAHRLPRWAARLARPAGHRLPRWAALLAVVLAVGFLGVPALAGVPARLVEGCGDWIATAAVLELLSAVGFVVFFKLVFAARVSWRRGAPAGLRALGASTILPGGGLIGPGVGAWSASAEKPSLAQLARATVAFTVLASAPAAVTLATLGTLLWLGAPGGPHAAALTVLPASIAALVIAGVWVTGRASRRRRSVPRRGGVLGALANGGGAFGGGVADAQSLLGARDWKLLGSVAYFAFDGAALWAAFHAYGHTPPIAVIGMGYLVGSLAGALPLPAGLGAVDGGLIGALALYGAPLAPAAAAVLLYRGISLLLPLALGAAGWVWSPALSTAVDDGRRAHPVQRARARRRAAAAELVTARAES